jgi:hypothetical protein
MTRTQRNEMRAYTGHSEGRTVVTLEFWERKHGHHLEPEDARWLARQLHRMARECDEEREMLRQLRQETPTA